MTPFFQRGMINDKLLTQIDVNIVWGEQKVSGCRRDDLYQLMALGKCEVKKRKNKEL